MRTVLGLGLDMLDRGRTDQREPQVADTLQESLQLRLVEYRPDEQCSPLLASERHAVERACETVAELSVDDQAISESCHSASIAHWTAMWAPSATLT
jgi:hypothetical protein